MPSRLWGGVKEGLTRWQRPGRPLALQAGTLGPAAPVPRPTYLRHLFSHIYHLT